MEKKSFLIIFLTVFMDLVGFGIVIPLNPYLAREFGADPLQVGLLMTIYSAFQFVASPIWGNLSDRWGRRPVILISVLGSALSHLAFGLSGHLWGLFLARGFAGLFGGNISAAMASVADITGPEQRAKGMGMIGAAFGLGFILGPFIGGVLGGTSYGAQFPAFIAAGICFLNFLIALKILPETNQNKTTTAIKSSRLGLVLIMLKKPTVNSVLVIYFLMSLAMAHMEASLFMLVQDRFNWTLSTASLGFAYVGVIMVITQGGIIRKTLPLWGEANSFLFGLSLLVLGYLGVGLATEISFLAIAVTLIGIGNGFANPALTATLSLLSEKTEQGGSMGVNQSLAALGRILGPATGGLIYRQLGPSFPFYVACGLVALSLWIGLRVRTKVPHTAR